MGDNGGQEEWGRAVAQLSSAMFTYRCAPHSCHSILRGGPHSRHNSGGGSDA